MKIAVISDVHANYTALKAVLEDMSAVDHLVCAGDITGYHRQVNEVVDLLSGVGARMILGNHDHYLVQGFFHVKLVHFSSLLIASRIRSAVMGHLCCLAPTAL